MNLHLLVIFSLLAIIPSLFALRYLASLGVNYVVSC